MKETSSYTTGKVSWFSKVWAQHIPGMACELAGGSHPATGPPAAGGWRLVDGGWWKSNAQLQGWVHVGVNRKCDSLRVQTNATRDHRQISLPHCVSATDDVTSVALLSLSFTMLCLSTASLLTARTRLDHASRHRVPQIPLLRAS